MISAFYILQIEPEVILPLIIEDNKTILLLSTYNPFIINKKLNRIRYKHLQLKFDTIIHFIPKFPIYVDIQPLTIPNSVIDIKEILDQVKFAGSKQLYYLTYKEILKCNNLLIRQNSNILLTTSGNFVTSRKRLLLSEKEFDTNIFNTICETIENEIQTILYNDQIISSILIDDKIKYFDDNDKIPVYLLESKTEQNYEILNIDEYKNQIINMINSITKKIKRTYTFVNNLITIDFRKARDSINKSLYITPSKSHNISVNTLIKFLSEFNLLNTFLFELEKMKLSIS